MRYNTRTFTTFLCPVHQQSAVHPDFVFPQMLSLTHRAQPRFMAPLTTFASPPPLPLRFGARSVCGIVPYNMPRELPPYMNISTSEQSTTKNTSVLRMLLLGKPCSGKGTLAASLSTKYDISTMSTGNLVRQHITARLAIVLGKFLRHRGLILVRTDIGRQAEEIVAAGGLLPDEMMLDLITTELDTLKENVGFLPPLCHA